MSLTADSWSFSEFNGSMAVTAHWFDINLDLKSLTLQIKRFHTLHNGDAAFSCSKNLFFTWGLQDNIPDAITSNERNLSKGLIRLCNQLNHSFGCTIDDSRGSYYGSADALPCSGCYHDCCLFHKRCIAHFINLSVRKYMSEISPHIIKIKDILNFMRSSVKLRDIYNDMKAEQEIKYDLPLLTAKRVGLQRSPRSTKHFRAYEP